MTERKKVVATLGEHSSTHCFRQADWERLGEVCELEMCFNANSDKAAYHGAIRGAQIILTGWGSPIIDAQEVALAPDLELVVHSAGSVAVVVGAPVWDAGARVSTANDVLGESVALTALAYTVDGLKQSFTLARLYKETRSKGCFKENPMPMRELYGLKVGIVGFGSVGRHLARLMLAVADPEILVSDPGVEDAELRAAACLPSDLEEICRTCDVIHNCVPWNPRTEGLFSHECFRMMKDDAIFINTGRGATVDEAGLAAELAKGRLQAYLDVQHPEPPEEDSPLWGLDNCYLFPHLAGFRGNGSLLLGRFAVDEILRYLAGDPLKGEITRAYAESMTGSKR